MFSSVKNDNRTPNVSDDVRPSEVEEFPNGARPLLIPIPSLDTDNCVLVTNILTGAILGAFNAPI